MRNRFANFEHIMNEARNRALEARKVAREEAIAMHLQAIAAIEANYTTGLQQMMNEVCA
jgi:hypothetical protein